MQTAQQTAQQTAVVDMVTAAVHSDDRYTAGLLLGKGVINQINKTGDNNIIKFTKSALNIVGVSDDDRLMDGFVREVFLTLYGWRKPS